MGHKQQVLRESREGEFELGRFVFYLPRKISRMAVEASANGYPAIYRQIETNDWSEYSVSMLQ